MPTHKPYTQISSLPLNAKGERTILEAHLDLNFSSLSDVLEIILKGIFSAGGVIAAGTVTVEDATFIRVVGRYGIAADVSAALLCADQRVDLSSVADGTKCRVYLEPAFGATADYSFLDGDTGESLTHTLGLYFGRLAFAEGDEVDYPDLPPSAVPVAAVTKAGGVATIDATDNTAPTPAAWMNP